MSQKSADVRIDIVSDVVCPWCIIGFKQLERALLETGTTAQLHWHPFELNPGMAPEGENLREHLAAKYGTTPEGSKKARDQLTQMGNELGFAFNYADDMRMYNTFRAHQLLRWAQDFGKQHELKMALFAAFFTDRRDVSDPEVLAEVAGSVNLDVAEAQAVLEDGRFAQEVREEENFWTARGIRGVPAVVFNLEHLVTGAQGTENYKAVLQKVMALAASS
ncbi:DsbA family oxidoreductase [Pseudovibrio sp. SPO723]|uniref:DsbA family oxidoreductase n=1 Tax=Nesiotobacter zosterae TaxID=392721 RepID=UPI0029C361BE|nr:DsbA family oxidoreductase [Pseudovibrio sp. SPO723]MDX5594349.1 DsbA family oxidoreductase [Pseudovibrio sp. SPO723]